ncbi:MAG: hypothetical protein P8Q39_03180 [Candidatus Thalassarchaeaceae archaeon]|nr:hypothetical protein [Candidatus Thalassarchaeaceae archaeon]
MSKDKPPLFPWSWPWCSSTGVPLRPLKLFLSRKFTFSYIILIWVFWLSDITGPANDCYITGGGFSCINGIWPSDLVDSPIRFFASLLIIPFFHNDPTHIVFVTLGFLVFVQSFEVREGTIRTYILFMICLSATAVVVSAGMHIGELIYPDSDFLRSGFARNWNGGSAGFFGIIGASSHQTRKVWMVPAIAIIFETWNHFINGISALTSTAHMVSMTVGFLLWGYWISSNSESRAIKEKRGS